MDLAQFFLLLLCPILGHIVFVKAVEIEISLGKLRGTIERTRANNSYHAFRGVRYVEKPGRFESSIPIKPWSGVYDATTDASTCIQGTPAEGPQSEDCLFLNVYTPQLPNQNETELLTVMFWVHGGGFYFGGSSFTSFQPDYFIDDNVVVVTINYRLGVFGFLSTGDARVPGNNGLKDLINGLAWVQQNIIFFGGDPQKVTIFGQSAGAILVSLMTMSPLTSGKGYFIRAITQSGNSLMPWGFQRDPKASYQKILDKTICLPAQLVNLDLECLKGLDLTLLGLAQAGLIAVDEVATLNLLNGLVFSPSIEAPGAGAAITNGSYELMKNGAFQNIPFISGVTANELIAPNVNIEAIKLLWQVNWGLSHFVPTDMYVSLEDFETVSQMIRAYYSIETIALWANKDFVQYSSDNMFNRAFRKYTSLVQNRVPNYSYIFSYKGPNGTMEAGHATDLPFLWAGSPMTESDIVVKNKMVRLWTNFAKTGNPTPNQSDDVLGSLIWPVSYIDSANINALDIDLNPEVIQNPMQDQFVMWSKLYDDYGNPRDTY